MLDLEGLSLTPEESELLQDPGVGGVILFARNYQSTEQVQSLIQQIRSVRPELVLAVDQEGGRVQRFKSGVTRLPPLRSLGEQFEQNDDAALHMAEDWGWLMAAEMTSLGVDISFAPVLDIDYGRSSVIGDRAFASNPEQIGAIANAYIHGMRSAGMAATGKHFPGHGWVEADSHIAIPKDERSLTDILQKDMVPFAQTMECLAGIMPAHVIYTEIDELPAGFSPFWIQQQLRGQLGFDGVVFSDDLTMEGATVMGGFADRADAAFKAGCDMVLVCNHRAGALEVLQWLRENPVAVQEQRFEALKAKPQWTWEQLQLQPKWQALHQQITKAE
ncbi:MAG: beta-N-acetylhexosaminidase [Pseudomonadales bacterium]|nr:beta-N-acetylhexosaminidase [Pseudomonadales bacterium]